jgi:hypothetical protein
LPVGRPLRFTAGGLVATRLAGWIRARWVPLSVIGAVALAAVVRARYVIAAGFPLRDGGMFFVMTKELQKAHFSLPAYTSYNAGGIPYDYPPLGFYIAGLLSSFTHIPLLTVFQYLPFAVSLVTVAAFFWLARLLLTSRVAVVAATVVFALLPGTFFLTIAGGGVSRSLGLLFAILALAQIVQLYRYGGTRRLLATSLLSGLTVLSHPEAPVFLAVSVVVLAVALGRNLAGLSRSVMLAVGTLTVTAPWWLIAVSRHGIEPFVRAAGAGSAGILGMFAGATLLTAVNITAETFFPVLYALAVLGLLCRTSERRRLIGWWAVAVALFDARGIAIYITVPIALLAGIGTADGLLPLLSGPNRGDMSRAAMSRAAFVLGCIVFYATVSAMMSATQTLQVLAPAERQAMAWAASNTPAESTFLVVDAEANAGPESPGGADRLAGQRFENVSEWFPALAARRSVATPQGQEWTNPHYPVAVRNYMDAQACAERDGDCLQAWASSSGLGYDYVYLPGDSSSMARAAVHQDCCWPLRSALRSDPRYRLVYDGPGGTIFKSVSTN